MEIAGNEIHNENREIRQKSLRTKEKCRRGCVLARMNHINDGIKHILCTVC